MGFMHHFLEEKNIFSLKNVLNCDNFAFKVKLNTFFTVSVLCLSGTSPNTQDAVEL